VPDLLFRKPIALVASLLSLVTVFMSLVIMMPARVDAPTPDPLQVRRDILANSDTSLGNSCAVPSEMRRKTGWT
jgi:hypothetical protein